jgi:membrane-associated phospholipid phosphatase
MDQHFRVPMETRSMPDAFVWQGRAGTPTDFTTFVTTESRKMADWLWPIYDRQRGAWVGKAAAGAVALTAADLDLMASLRSFLPMEAKSLDRKLKQTHKAFFFAEDLSARETLELYMPPLPEKLLAAMKESVVKGLAATVGNVKFRFKDLFQRPRPYQVAYILNREFRYEYAQSAVTPSMISGHCIQGLVGRTSAFMALPTRMELDLVPEAVESLQQYCVDIGDRRVFAGVHYPSDNISSWYLGLRLCDHVFGETGQIAKDFMWQAIQRSNVYNGIVAVAPASPYAVLLQMLQKEAKRPVGEKPAE